MTIFLPNISASLPRKHNGLKFSLNFHASVIIHAPGKGM
jgi:hypothetical protein